MVNPQPNRTVSGKILSTTTTVSEPGFTVRAFDAISTTNIVPLSNPIPLTADSYRIAYTWRSTEGRNGPNLLVRVFNPQGAIVDCFRLVPGCTRFSDHEAKSNHRPIIPSWLFCCLPPVFLAEVRSLSSINSTALPIVSA